MVDLSNFSYDKVAYVAARVQHASNSLALVVLGIQAFMCIYGLIIFLESPPARRQGRLPYIIVSLVIFFLSTLASGIDSYLQFQGGWEQTSGKSYYAITARLEAEPPRIVSLVCFLLSMAVGDGLLLYRSYIVWQDKWWVNVLPGLTYLASIGMGIRCLLPQSVADVRVNASAWTFLTIAMNIMVTFLISLRLLVTSRSISKMLGSSQRMAVGRTPYAGVVAILIEAALPLTAFGLGYAISLVVDAGITTESVSRWQTVNGVFAALYFTFVAISPQMIIFRVTTGRSWLSSPAKSEPALSRPIAFANGLDNLKDKRGPIDSESYFRGVDSQMSVSMADETETKKSAQFGDSGYAV